MCAISRTVHLAVFAVINGLYFFNVILKLVVETLK